MRRLLSLFCSMLLGIALFSGCSPAEPEPQYPLFDAQDGTKQSFVIDLAIRDNTMASLFSGKAEMKAAEPTVENVVATLLNPVGMDYVLEDGFYLNFGDVKQDESNSWKIYVNEQPAFSTTVVQKDDSILIVLEDK